MPHRSDRPLRRTPPTTPASHDDATAQWPLPGSHVTVHSSPPATYPVRALRAWLDAAQITEGPVFRAVTRHGHVGARLQARDVARIIKRAANTAGLDPSEYSGHSLRAGLATTAARAGKADRTIMRQGRWASRSMVDRYVREATLFEDNAAAGIGL